MSALSDVPANQLRAGGAKRLDRAEIPGPIDDDGVAGIDQAPREQIEPLLRTGENQHALGRHLEPLGDRLAQRRLPLGRAVPPDRTAIAAEHLVDRLLKRRGREAIDRRLAGRQRQQPRSDECRIASRSVESLDRSAAAAIFPRHANGVPAGSGAAQTNVPRPTYPRSSPRDSSSRYADTTVVRLIRSRCASSRSGGSREPDGRSPRAMADSNRWTRWPYSGRDVRTNCRSIC